MKSLVDLRADVALHEIAPALQLDVGMYFSPHLVEVHLGDYARRRQGRTSSSAPRRKTPGAPLLVGTRDEGIALYIYLVMYILW